VHDRPTQYGKDPAGFDAFVRAELRNLVGFVMAAGADYDEARDAVQQALTEAFATWSTVDWPRGWVRTAAVRHVVRVRERDRKRTVLEVRSHHAVWQVTELAESAVVRAMELGRIFDDLPPQQLEVLRLEIMGWSTSEIALVLGVADATVRSHLRHARVRLSREGFDPPASAAPRSRHEGGPR
jgi:RNA polymerase sigma factor (sigma-70 family)